MLTKLESGTENLQQRENLINNQAEVKNTVTAMKNILKESEDYPIHKNKSATWKTNYWK